MTLIFRQMSTVLTTLVPLVALRVHLNVAVSRAEERLVLAHKLLCVARAVRVSSHVAVRIVVELCLS